MRAYLGITGAVFALVTVAHLLRTGEMMTHLAEEPWSVILYNVLTLMTAALAGWAWHLLRRTPATGS